VLATAAKDQVSASARVSGTHRYGPPVRYLVDGVGGRGRRFFRDAAWEAAMSNAVWAAIAGVPGAFTSAVAE
jgi:hypothetical protein